jgi:hypothetical protein
MIEPERAEAAGRAAFYYHTREMPRDHPKYLEWEDLDDATRNDWRLLAVKVVEKYFTGAPGDPCVHKEWKNTGRCVHMGCSNYIERQHGIRVGSPTDLQHPFID